MSTDEQYTRRMDEHAAAMRRLDDLERLGVNVTPERTALCESITKLAREWLDNLELIA